MVFYWIIQSCRAFEFAYTCEFVSPADSPFGFLFGSASAQFEAVWTAPLTVSSGRRSAGMAFRQTQIECTCELSQWGTFPALFFNMGNKFPFALSLC
jgi:hypothetical protein